VQLNSSLLALKCTATNERQLSGSQSKTVNGLGRFPTAVHGRVLVRDENDLAFRDAKESVKMLPNALALWISGGRAISAARHRLNQAALAGFARKARTPSMKASTCGSVPMVTRHQFS
jgi:hypothetical protein